MSFRCDICNEAQPGGHMPIQVVVETRTKRYPDTSKIGIETVKEVTACPPCSEPLLVKQLEERIIREEEMNRLIVEQKAMIGSPSPYLDSSLGTDWDEHAA